MDRFLELAARNVVDTAAYLLAYRGAPIAALVSAVLLVRFAPVARFESWARDPRHLRSLAGGVALGTTGAGAASVLGERIGALADRPQALVAYLATSHGLTAYYLLLTGPLLGKDVLVSHLIGLTLFTAIGGALCRLSGWQRFASPASAVRGAAPRSATRLAGAEAFRGAVAMAVGLVLGGAIAAWGLSGPRPALVEAVGAGGSAQAAQAALAIGVSFVTWMAPVVNLFVGTYLWKVGLAHAGLVAFLLAATLSPPRLRLYRERLGPARGLRLAVALLGAALLAAMATAAIYATTPLAINYKLIPEQMW